MNPLQKDPAAEHEVLACLMRAGPRVPVPAELVLDYVRVRGIGVRRAEIAFIDLTMRGLVTEEGDGYLVFVRP